MLVTFCLCLRSVFVSVVRVVLRLVVAIIRCRYRKIKPHQQDVVKPWHSHRAVT